MNPLAVLFADGGWIGLIAFVVFIVFSILSKLAGQLQEVQKEAARRARANPPQTPRRPSDSLEDEIAEFLKRAAERQKPAQAESSRPAQPDRPTTPPPPPVTEPAMRPFRPPPLRPVTVPAEPEVVVAIPVEDETVAEHVRDRFARPQFGQVGSAGLGREVARADEKVDERLRGKFGREVGRLSATPGEAAAASVAPVSADRLAASFALDAASLAALLTNPATLRQTILASEILHRPEERWRR